MPLTISEVVEWLTKAERDLLSAEILIDHEPPVLDAACFHCQQAVEKALKAFLVWQAIPFERVHNLTYLLDLCVSKEVGWVSLRERAESLTPYAVEARYPGELLDVDRAEAADALESARAVWNFVLGLLPEELRPHKLTGKSEADESC
jgi:HEPN domain-containing protein